MWTIKGFSEDWNAKREKKNRQEAAITRDAAISRDIMGGPPASPKAARAQSKALKKNRPPATTDPSGKPYPPITEVSPGYNQKKRQKWQDSANKTRRPQP